MGSNSCSTLFFGIHWDSNYVFKNEFYDDYDEDEIDKKVKEIDKRFTFKTIYCHEHTHCLAYEDSYHNGDWDSAEIISLDKIKTIKEPEIKEVLKNICERLEMNYQEPKFQMISHYW